MSGGLDVRPEVEVLVLHGADRHVAREGALLRRRRRRRQVRAVVAVAPPHNLKFKHWSLNVGSFKESMF